MSAPFNVWQYSRWVYIVGRSLRINPPSRDERAAIKVYLAQELVTRPYLAQYLGNKSGLSGGLSIASESDYSLAKMVAYVGRDLKKIPMSVTERGYADTLLSATGTRALGYKGGPAGDIHSELDPA